MLLGDVFQSAEAWRKLSAINMKPKLAYEILKYAKLVTAEWQIIAKQHDAMVHEITGTQEGQAVTIKAGTPESEIYAVRRKEIMDVESALTQLDMDFEEVVNAIDEKDESLTVSDLAMLEPFFKSLEEEEDFRNKDGTPKMELDGEKTT